VSLSELGISGQTPIGLLNEEVKELSAEDRRVEERWLLQDQFTLLIWPRGCMVVGTEVSN
jgi:hypothetical protein